MTITTLKFSQMQTAAVGDQSNEPVGLSEGINSRLPPNEWTTSTRPSSPFNGLLGYNVTLSQYEYWNAGISSWIQLTTGGTGTVTTVNTGTGLTGGPITTSGTISLALGGTGNPQISANSGVGIPVQVVFNSLSATTSIAAVSPITTGLNVTITPTLTTSKILLMAIIYVDVPNTDNGFLQFFNGTNPIGIGAAAGSRTLCGGSINGLANGSLTPVTLIWVDSPASVSAITYSVEMWTSLGSQSYVNRSISDLNSSDYPRTVSTITAMEIK